jgi:phospholipid-binding lipoprotein MlaA
MLPEKTMKKIAQSQRFGQLVMRVWLTAVIAILLEMSGLNAGSVRAEDPTHLAPLYEQFNESYLAYAITDPAPSSSHVAEAEGAAAGKDFDEDPWEPFNEKMFWFNRNVFDRFLLKPIANAWDFVLPNPVQRSIRNALDNLFVVKRLANNLLQLKFQGAGREVARFTINSTVGVVGFFDVAKYGLGIEQSDEDTGQTLGVYGLGPGPYLVLPFLPPLTVRDGFGLVADTAMNPLNYFIPIGASLGIAGTNAVNERSLNLNRFEQIEQTTFDLYGAVRDAYLQRRAAAIRE